MRPTAYPIAILLATLCACTTVDRLNAPALSGAPASSALALLRVEASARNLRGYLSQQVVMGGTLQRIDDGQYVETKAAAGYLVFSDLAPGAYRLVTLRTTATDDAGSLAHLYRVPLDSTRAYDLELRAGEPCFLGVIAVLDVLTGPERGVSFEVRDRARGEAQGWQWFARVYSASPWAAASRAPSATCTRR